MSKTKIIILIIVIALGALAGTGLCRLVFSFF